MTSDYRVSPQRSSSIIVSRLLRDLFAPHRPPPPRESSTLHCVASTASGTIHGYPPARRSRIPHRLRIFVLPTFQALQRVTSARSPLVQSAFALHVHQAVALHLGSTSPSSPTSSSHLHQPCSPCSPQQFITGFPRLPRAGFHHFHFFIYGNVF